MESVLIISFSEKSAAFLKELLSPDFSKDIAMVSNCQEARRLYMQRGFDLCIINAPLRDEAGEHMARHVAVEKGSQVILLTPYEYFEEVSAQVEDVGVITLSKPVNKGILWNALKMAKAANSLVHRLQSENSKLIQKLEDIKIVDRAKCILISYLRLTEVEAHKYIEKKAMDTRSSKREVAEEILKTYES